MAIVFDWYENPNASSEEEAALHPRIFMNGKVDTDTLCYKIHDYSSLTVGDVKNVLDNLSKILGESLREGKEVHIKSPIDAIRYGMGYVSEERRHDGIAPDMSVMENMMLPSYDKIKKHGLIDYRQAIETAEKYISSFKIKTASRETLIKNLSGGNQQKVIVARWMAKGIKMLILDEPTRGIDVNAKGEIHQLIRDLADNGVSVVVISSEMEEVMALSDRIMVVHQGRISGYITDVDLITQEDVLKVAFQ